MKLITAHRILIVCGIAFFVMYAVIRTQKYLAADKKVAPRVQAEMMKRGVITRVRPVAGAHPAPGDTIYFAPPLVVTDREIDRLISVTGDAVKAVLGV